VVSGYIEGAYMNEDGDVAFIWDIQADTIEALFLNGWLVLKEGDEVDVTGDGIPDAGAVLENFTGISSLTMSDRDPSDETVQLYFTADVNLPPTRVASRDFASSAVEPAGAADAEARGLEGMPEESPRTRDARATVEGFFMLIANPDPTGVSEPSSRSERDHAGLLNVYPNPAHSQAMWIRFDVPRTGWVTLAVFDLAGRRVRTLESGQRSAGQRTVRWDGRDEEGRRVAAGPYFVRFTAAGESATERVVLVR
jgi:hypothetical protein